MGARLVAIPAKVKRNSKYKSFATCGENENSGKETKPKRDQFRRPVACLFSRAPKGLRRVHVSFYQRGEANGRKGTFHLHVCPLNSGRISAMSTLDYNAS